MHRRGVAGGARGRPATPCGRRSGRRRPDGRRRCRCSRRGAGGCRRRRGGRRAGARAATGTGRRGRRGCSGRGRTAAAGRRAASRSGLRPRGPSNGSRPVSASYSRAPTRVPVAGGAERAAGRPAPAPCSATVPATSELSPVCGSSSVTRPKSSRTTRPAQGDEDVGRLDVAVQLAGGVQSRHPGDELPQCGPQSGELGGVGQILRRCPRPGRHGAPPRWGPRCTARSRRRLPAPPSGSGRCPRRLAGGAAVIADGNAVGVGAGRLGAVADVLEEADAVDQLHREEPAAVVADQLVEGGQVDVGHVGERTELALEVVQQGGVGARQRLEGDAAAALLVDGLVDDAHAAGAEAAHDREACRSPESRRPV